MKIVGINASLSGTKTARALDIIKFNEADYRLVNLKDLKMSFADGRDYREYDNDNKEIIQALIDADGILIGTPIYQASIPGVLKNLFDLLPPNALQGKTVGLIVTAGSPRHYLVAEHQIMPILHYLKTNVITKYVFLEPSDFNDDTINDDISLRIETLEKTMLEEVKIRKEQDKKLYDFL